MRTKSRLRDKVFGPESDPEAETRREAGSELVRSMARLSVPSFVTIVGCLGIWLFSVLAPANRPPSLLIGLSFFAVPIAMICQLVTVPKAAVLLYRQFKGSAPGIPSGERGVILRLYHGICSVCLICGAF
jgi:hypothetical protein